MKYGKQLDSKAQTYIAHAIDGANRMTSMIDELLEYSRVGRVHDEMEEVDLSLMVPDLLRDLPGAEEADISIQELPVIKAVPVSIKSLFRNLISNGLKYKADGKKPAIRIQFTDENQFWKFSISDNGIGIEKRYVVEIFQLFKRLHTTSEYSGSGMGLAISKKIVEQHGGDIWVESEVGKGSTFYFTIQKK
jgi:light-regulated signal transduction histidine kinase (bacteriophytochrome)